MELSTSGKPQSPYFTSSERLAVLIDGSDLRATVGGLGLDIDFMKLLSYFRDSSRLARMMFYFVDRDEEDGVSLRSLTDWLDYNGYSTVACAGSDTDSEIPGRRRNKNFLNVRLAVDALDLASSVDHIVIFSGDAVLGPLIDSLKWRGRRVSIVSTLQLRPPMIADDLRRRADQFIDITDIIEHIIRDVPVERKVRRARAVASPKSRSSNSPA